MSLVPPHSPTVLCCWLDLTLRVEDNSDYEDPPPLHQKALSLTPPFPCRVVKEEISDDNAKLPCFNGRVVSWVRSRLPLALSLWWSGRKGLAEISAGDLMPPDLNLPLVF